MKREKTYRIKTNNQELLIRKENESDATSRWIITGNEKEILLCPGSPLERGFNDPGASFSSSS